MKKANRGVNKKTEIKKRYESSSSIYDQRYKIIQFEKYKQIISEIQFNDNIIFDAGCGTGLFIDFFYEFFPENLNSLTRYVGVDISLNMLKILKSKVTQDKVLSNKISLILADLENLPLRSHSMDILLSVTAYQNLPTIKRGISESLRTLREGSNFQISILKKKIAKEKLLEFLKSKAKLSRIIDNETIEDIIIQGVLTKQKTRNP